MPRPKALNPRHAAIKNYYKTLDELRAQNVENESALRPAFQNLLAESARLHGWTLIPELSTESRGRTVIPDGTVRDRNYLPRGYWEAKDTADDLPAEIEKKLQRGYPTSNIIFEDTQQAILYQDKREVLRADLTNPVQLVDLVDQFHNHVEPEIETFEKAVEEFKDRVPGLGAGLKEKIREAHANNPRFEAAFEEFYDLCRKSLNPNLSRDAVDEMLIQHLLTERLFRTVLDDTRILRSVPPESLEASSRNGSGNSWTPAWAKRVSAQSTKFGFDGFTLKSENLMRRHSVAIKGQSSVH